MCFSLDFCVRVCERAYTSADTCSQSLICTCCLVVSRQVSHQPGELLLEEPSANCLNSCLCLCSRFSVCWGACLCDSPPVSFPSCLVGPTSACSCAEMKRWLRFRLFLYPLFFSLGLCRAHPLKQSCGLPLTILSFFEVFSWDGRPHDLMHPHYSLSATGELKLSPVY